MTKKSIKIAVGLFGLAVSCGSMATDVPFQIKIITDAFKDSNVRLFYSQILHAYFAKKMEKQNY